jgi:hypothetical protein
MPDLASAPVSKPPKNGEAPPDNTVLWSIWRVVPPRFRTAAMRWTATLIVAGGVVYGIVWVVLQLREIDQHVDDHIGRIAKMAVENNATATTQRLDTLQSRMDGHDQRLDTHDKRFDATDAKLDNIGVGLGRIEGKIDTLTQQVNAH